MSSLQPPSLCPELQGKPQSDVSQHAARDGSARTANTPAGNVAQQLSAQLCERAKQFVEERQIEHGRIENFTTGCLDIEEKKEATRQRLQAICKAFCDEDPIASLEQPHQTFILRPKFPPASSKPQPQPFPQSQQPLPAATVSDTPPPGTERDKRLGELGGGGGRSYFSHLA
ncbi:hypothetical protein CMUS01_10879 [Colletotrichum musicola]|uniref:Uncharacterized protein n=1 Tax=Colletotrichum musicola TaxID=2175873 RepID=A0A8H6N7X0_9PEZI|nr:hypothetical protein CMUS01_10879 [Colletotrichum musicola]